jgi:hypothetical protein
MMLIFSLPSISFLSCPPFLQHFSSNNIGMACGPGEDVVYGCMHDYAGRRSLKTSLPPSLQMKLDPKGSTHVLSVVVCDEVAPFNYIVPTLALNMQSICINFVQKQPLTQTSLLAGLLCVAC